MKTLLLKTLCLTTFTLSFFFTANGQEKSNEGESISQNQRDSWTRDLGFAISVLEQNYAYQSDINLDWRSIRASYERKLRRVDSSGGFFLLLEQLVDEPHDHHLHLNQNHGESFRLVPSELDVWIEHKDDRYIVEDVRQGSDAKQAGLKPGDVLLSVNGIRVFEAVEARLKPFVDKESEQAKSWAARTLVAGRQSQTQLELSVVGADKKHRDLSFKIGKSRTNDQLITQSKLGDGIDCIRIENALGQDQLVSEFDKAIDSVMDSATLILDLRNAPGGGNTSVARGIMGRLVSAESAYQRHEFIEQPLGIPRIWVEYVSPRGPAQYRGKVIVLVGRWTGSMGEGLAIGLDGMRRAKTIGTAMAGLRGATRRYDLPNSGIGIFIPTEKLFHVDGTPREKYMPNEVVDLIAADASIDQVMKRAVLSQSDD